MSTELRALVRDVASRAAEAEDFRFADYLLEEVKKPDEAFVAFLRSNEMWGGSGSVADSAAVAAERIKRRRVEEALIALGEAQISKGIANPRTQGWLDAFRHWKTIGA